MEQISVVLGKRIKNLRISQKLSQEKLAELSGLHSTYIGQIERGEKSPTIESIYKICMGLNISLPVLFENFTPNIDTETYANKIYNEVLALEPEKQLKIYKILKEILLF